MVLKEKRPSAGRANNNNNVRLLHSCNCDDYDVLLPWCPALFEAKRVDFIRLPVCCWYWVTQCDTLMPGRAERRELRHFCGSTFHVDRALASSPPDALFSKYKYTWTTLWFSSSSTTAAANRYPEMCEKIIKKSFFFFLFIFSSGHTQT